MCPRLSLYWLLIVIIIPILTILFIPRNMPPGRVAWNLRVGRTWTLPVIITRHNQPRQGDLEAIERFNIPCLMQIETTSIQAIILIVPGYPGCIVYYWCRETFPKGIWTWPNRIHIQFTAVIIIDTAHGVTSLLLCQLIKRFLLTEGLSIHLTT